MPIKPNKTIMKAAIGEAESNRTPFGTALAMGDQVFATAHNSTEELNDSKTHAVYMVIRSLQEQLQKDGLSGFVLYSTYEPCSACMSIVFNAGVKSVIYGCDRAYFLKNPEQRNLQEGLDVQDGFMKDQCIELFNQYFEDFP